MVESNEQHTSMGWHSCWFQLEQMNKLNVSIKKMFAVVAASILKRRVANILSPPNKFTLLDVCVSFSRPRTIITHEHFETIRNMKIK